MQITHNDIAYLHAMARRISHHNAADLVQEGCVVLCEAESNGAKQNRKAIAAAMMRWLYKFSPRRAVELFDSMPVRSSCRMAEYSACDADRELLEMRYVSRMTFHEIAEATGGSYAAVHRRHAQIIETLKAVVAA